ncbi:uncharacterized protein BDZ99DRAFT_176093 [Mytilinidion resinicola]|uniref:Uncharacterized protein n=1 Tax=Mytilinidion resinicola TaxID=574789 RepID=A0A6A6Y3U5_9PEZI|nr:uncharacterized protein BDZ99DRAFT_176093 [Mytilinidion resinicola]KAF2803193.1 hypothetical protein BDZ99DRAFT_176093 [Mytilinidion resinicola]
MSFTTYNVYRIEYELGLQDPLMEQPTKRYHNVIFIETDVNGRGRKLQVTGAIGDLNGMVFVEEQGLKPENTDGFWRKSYLGQIQASDYGKVVELLKGLDPPPRQRIFDTTTMAWQKCKPDGTLYGPQEEVPPYRKCTEWTLEEAIPALIKSGFLHAHGVALQRE